MRIKVPVLTLAILTGSCAVGPNYQRPAIPAPVAFRAPDPLPTDEAVSIGDLKWFEVFGDAKLQALIKIALTSNYDLRDAVARVEEARARVGVTRSNQFPNVSATGGVEFNRFSRNGRTVLPEIILPAQERTFGQVALTMLSFEVDIWGKLRRATEAARANLLSADETRKAVVTTLVSEVATNYLTLIQLDYELEISRRTLGTRQQSLELTRLRQQGGVGTLLDLRQSEQLVAGAEQVIPQILQEIEQTENQVNLLLGNNPGSVDRGQSLDAVLSPPQVPPGIPSRLLERRPDIRAAEQSLVAANANIGVAKAAYFPQVSLSGFLGGQSTELSNLFAGPNGAWAIVSQVSQPIFTAGRLKSNVKLTEAQRDQALIDYERTIQTAFAEVSNALIAHQRVHETREKQEVLVAALRDRLRLAYMRYRGGVDTQLNALDADRDLFTAELALVQTRLNESLAVVQLYKALGGGWQ